PYIETIKAFVKLGNYLTVFCEKWYNDADDIDPGLSNAIAKAGQMNGWFTHENILFALQQWGELLTEENILGWLSHYPIGKTTSPKTVGIVMAGNIPLVGFHDFLCVLLSGNKVLAKLSSNDKVLL